jgi:hypothetical protein
MWMKNGGRCYARWLLKDHASSWKPKGAKILKIILQALKLLV